MRDLFLDTLLRGQKEKKAQNPAGSKPTNSSIFPHKAHAVPLWLNHCPHLKLPTMLANVTREVKVLLIHHKGYKVIQEKRIDAE